MKIIDAQVHIWSQTVVPPGGGHRQVSRFTAEELLAWLEGQDLEKVMGRGLATWISWDYGFDS